MNAGFEEEIGEWLYQFVNEYSISSSYRDKFEGSWDLYFDDLGAQNTLEISEWQEIHEKDLERRKERFRENEDSSFFGELNPKNSQRSILTDIVTRAAYRKALNDYLEYQESAEETLEPLGKL